MAWFTIVLPTSLVFCKCILWGFYLYNFRQRTSLSVSFQLVTSWMVAISANCFASSPKFPSADDASNRYRFAEWKTETPWSSRVLHSRRFQNSGPEVFPTRLPETHYCRKPCPHWQNLCMRPGFVNGDQLTAVALQANLAASNGAFALWCSGGDSIVTWGKADHGGDSSAVQSQLNNVQQVVATHSAFAAILDSGAVVAWGASECGGNSSIVQDRLQNVQQIQATARAFAAMLADGSVVAWGDPKAGGASFDVQDLRNVQQVRSAEGGAFAAILEDGSVVTWGSLFCGGDCSAIQDQLRSVQQVQATHFCNPGRRISGYLGQSRFWWG